MIFNTNEIRASLQNKFGSEVINSASLFNVNREAVFIDPMYQRQVFNFLFYEKQWRFNRLHDMMLLFEPGMGLTNYLLQYEISSRQFQHKLRVLLPFQFEQPTIYSLQNLYRNAASLEQKMTVIHNLHFMQKVSRLTVWKEQVKAAMLLFPF
jgi:hypothetical protein